MYQIPLKTRLVMGIAGLLLVILFMLAAGLDPEPHGYGTHKQLGLPGCWFIQELNIRCPSCGMTTSWAHLMNADLLASLNANTGGFLLAILSLLAAPWLLARAITGRWNLDNYKDKWVIFTIAIWICVVLIEWIIRLI